MLGVASGPKAVVQYRDSISELIHSPHMLQSIQQGAFLVVRELTQVAVQDRPQ